MSFLISQVPRELDCYVVLSACPWCVARPWSSCTLTTICRLLRHTAQGILQPRGRFCYLDFLTSSLCFWVKLKTNNPKKQQPNKKLGWHNERRWWHVSCCFVTQDTVPAPFMVSPLPEYCLRMTFACMVKRDTCVMFGRQNGGSDSSFDCAGCTPVRVPAGLQQWLPEARWLTVFLQFWGNRQWCFSCSFL